MLRFSYGCSWKTMEGGEMDWGCGADGRKKGDEGLERICAGPSIPWTTSPPPFLDFLLSLIIPPSFCFPKFCLISNLFLFRWCSSSSSSPSFSSIWSEPTRGWLVMKGTFGWRKRAWRLPKLWTKSTEPGWTLGWPRNDWIRCVWGISGWSDRSELKRELIKGKRRGQKEYGQIPEAEHQEAGEGGGRRGGMIKINSEQWPKTINLMIFLKSPKTFHAYLKIICVNFILSNQKQ